MPLKMTASGEDDLGSFEVSIPGHCGSCDEDTDVVLKYAAQPLGKTLRSKGIDPTSNSLLLKRKREIGVTCGCYARFHRQVAHIGSKRSQKDQD